MAENALSPAFVRINYQSSWSIHTMTLPSVPYRIPSDPLSTDNSGNFILRGAALPTAADDAVLAFVNLLKTQFTLNTQFVDYTIFTQENAESAPIPRFTGALGIAGTGAATTWAKAVQVTYTFKTEDFGIFKLVMLDANSGNVYDVVRYNSLAAPEKAIADYITANVSWLSGRDGARPVTFLQKSVTLNEKLRRAYKMV